MKNILLKIRYEKKAEKFLEKNGSKFSKADAGKLIIQAVKRLSGKVENIDLVKMKGDFEGYFRIRKNDLRIIFNILEDNDIIIVTIANIDFRGNVYK